METATLFQYLPGLVFLALANVIIALPFAIFIRSKTLSVLFSVIASTFILKTWAYFSMGGLDAAFLLILIVVGSVTSYSVKKVANSIRPPIRRAQ